MKRSTWIMLGILVLAGYVVVRFAPPLVRNFQFNYFLNKTAEDADTLNDAEILRDIKQKIEELNLPIPPERVYPKPLEPDYLELPYLYIERGEGFFAVECEYQRTVELFLGRISFPLTFTPGAYAEIGRDGG